MKIRSYKDPFYMLTLQLTVLLTAAGVYSNLLLNIGLPNIQSIETLSGSNSIPAVACSQNNFSVRPVKGLRRKNT